MVVKQGTHVNASLNNPNPSSLRDHTRVPQRVGEALGGLVSTGAWKPITVWENLARPSDVKCSYYRKLSNKIFSEIKKSQNITRAGAHLATFGGSLYFSKTS